MWPLPFLRCQVNDTVNSDQVVIFDGIVTNYTAVPLPDQGDSLHIMVTVGDAAMSIMVSDIP